MQGSIAYLSSSLTVTCCRIWTACLWYSNWACTSAESWLTCSICRWMEKSCLSYQVNTLKQYCPYIHHLLPLDIRVPGSPVFRLTLQDLHQGLLTSAKSLGLWPVTQSYLFTASQAFKLALQHDTLCSPAFRKYTVRLLSLHACLSWFT